MTPLSDEDIWGPSASAPAVAPSTMAPPSTGPAAIGNGELPAPVAGSRQNPVNVTTPEHLDTAAQRVNTSPSDAQKEAGNYAKAHVRFQGMDVAVETPKGAERRGISPEGNEWSNSNDLAHYGYIKKTTAADGEHFDTYVGPNPQSDKVFIFDQYDPKTGKFDEHKSVIGSDTLDQATAIYDRGFSDGSGPSRRKGVREMSVSEFKGYLGSGDLTKPAAAQTSTPAKLLSDEDIWGSTEAPADEGPPFPGMHFWMGKDLKVHEAAPQEPAKPQWKPSQPFGGEFVMDQRPSMTSAERNPATIDPEREAGFWQRLGASFKMNPKGVASYFESLGYKAATDHEGNLFLLDTTKNQWFPVNQPGPTANDAADLGGWGLQTAPEVAAGFLTKGSPAGAAAGAAAGSAIRQAVSSLLPGEDNMTLEERLKSGATDALTAGATQFGVNKILQAVDKIRPGNVAAKYVNQQFKTPFAKESENISAQTGQQYTPGQATGSKGLLTMEGLVRRHPWSADTMAEFDQKQLDSSLNFLNRVMDRITPSGGSGAVVGKKVSEAFNQVVDSATSIRSKTAAVDFGQVDKLAGRYRVIKPTNLNDEIDTLTKDFAVPGGGDASSALVRQLNGIKTDLAKRAGPDGLTAQQTQRLLEVYGKAARGTGAIFKDLDTGQQRLIAGRLQKAVLKDLDAAADGGGHVGDIADALKTARNNYRTNSQAINQMQNSVLGRLFGGTYDRAPERIAQAMTNMRPSELRESFNVLNQADPEVAQQVKRSFIEKSLVDAGLPASQNVPAAQIAGQQAFSPQKFLTSIRKSPVWDIMEPTERGSLGIAVRDLERLANRAGTDGSSTTPLQFAWELSKGIGGNLLNPVGAAKAVAGAVLPRRAARLITDPAGRKALRTMRTASPDTRAYSGAAAYAATVMGRDQDQADDRPDASLDAALANE